MKVGRAEFASMRIGELEVDTLRVRALHVIEDDRGPAPRSRPRGPRRKPDAP
jgi:hypothetical protein